MKGGGTHNGGSGRGELLRCALHTIPLMTFFPSFSRLSPVCALFVLCLCSVCALLCALLCSLYSSVQPCAFIFDFSFVSCVVCGTGAVKRDFLVQPRSCGVYVYSVWVYGCYCFSVMWVCGCYSLFFY